MFLQCLRPSLPRTLRSPHLWFWGFALLHFLLWTLVPWSVNPNAPLDVIEGYAWGHEWLIGTYKHPPMQAWWLEILAILTDHASWVHFLASQIAVVVAFWAVWDTARHLMNGTKALLGVLLLEGVIYFNFTSTEFNPNVLLLPFWSLICRSYYRAIKFDKISDWLLLGLWIAGGLYSKYSTLLVIGLLATLTLAQPTARRRLKSIGPYLTIALTTLLFAPHMRWLLSHNLQPIAYAESRSHHAIDFQHILSQSLCFLSSQILAIAGAVILFLILCKGRVHWRNDHQNSDFDRVFLHTIALAPIIAIVFSSLLTGLVVRDMWGSSLWGFIGVWALYHVHLTPARNDLRRFFYAWIFIFLLGLTASAASDLFGPLWLKHGKRSHFPGYALAQQINQTWEERMHAPLTYVVGETWLAGNLAYYTQAKTAADRPHVFIQADSNISPWIDTDHFKQNGGVLIWCDKHCLGEDYAKNIPAYLFALFPNAVLQQPLTLAWQTIYHVPTAAIGWAIIPPSP